jgi:hypothetical protein
MQIPFFRCRQGPILPFLPGLVSFYALTALDGRIILTFWTVIMYNVTFWSTILFVMPSAISMGIDIGIVMLMGIDIFVGIFMSMDMSIVARLAISCMVMLDGEVVLTTILKISGVIVLAGIVMFSFSSRATPRESAERINANIIPISTVFFIFYPPIALDSLFGSGFFKMQSQEGINTQKTFLQDNKFIHKI